MLIIGKNIRNQTTKIQIAYIARAGLDLMTDTCGCPRPELMRARAIGRNLVVGLWENEWRLKQIDFDWHILEEVVECGNGGEASLDAPPIMNKM